MMRIVPRHTTAVSLTMLALPLLMACGSGDGSVAPVVPPVGSTGSLVVTVGGLPADVPASVVVTGPAGFSRTVSATETLTGLAVGTYTITPSRASDRSIGYAAPAVTAAVSGGTVSAAATYILRVLPRSSTNRTDESTLGRIKLLYTVPSDGTDRGFDTTGTIHRSISSGQRWLASQTAGRSFRYDVSDGGLDITFVRLPRTDAVYYSYGAFIRDSMEKDLRAAGLNQANVLLLVYYDGRVTDRCGSSAQPPRLPGTLAGVYLRGAANLSTGCNTQPLAATPTALPGYMDFVAVHELFHITGFVSAGAPNHVLSGHVGNDPTDLMYAGPLVWRPSVVDVSKSNYYNPSGLPTGVSNFIGSPYVVSAP
jgi:hypothetical protein